LILIDAFGIEQEAADEGAFAVVDAAGGGKAQEVLILLLAQEAFERGFAIGGRGRDWLSRGTGLAPVPHWLRMGH